MQLSPLESHLLLDTRLRERFLRDGIIEEKTVAQDIKALPDLAGEVIHLQAWEEAALPSETVLSGKKNSGELTFAPMEEE